MDNGVKEVRTEGNDVESTVKYEVKGGVWVKVVNTGICKVGDGVKTSGVE